MASQPKILVIGDVMLDRYISGSVDRISPEAPVPVVKVKDEWSTLGGAGNVAANVSALGGIPALIGLVGVDNSADELAHQCEHRNITAHLFPCAAPTVCKTRIISSQQILRVDREEHLVWNEEQLEKLFLVLEEAVSDTDIILLSDYAKGTLSDSVLEMVMNLATTHNKRVLIDPKRANWEKYRGAYIVSPNLKELAEATGIDIVENEDNKVVRAGKNLKDKYRLEHLVCTRSSYGMTVLSEGGLLNIPTRAQEVFDVSGAGDTVLATLGVMLAEGKTVAESAFAANAAAGLVISKMGTATVDRNELNAFLNTDNKLLDRGRVSEFSETHKGQRVVFTNGCFDVLHQGHRNLLNRASKLGDRLVVGINSDSSVKKLKGTGRPINSQTDRVHAISALPFVDHVIVFEEDTPYELLQELKADVLVKGGDYTENDVVGKELVDQVVILDLVEGVSTTNLVS